VLAPPRWRLAWDVSLRSDQSPSPAGGRALFYGEGHGGALLATIRDGEPPRIHPISVGIVGDTADPGMG
jgi:hypothetical protein